MHTYLSLMPEGKQCRTSLCAMENSCARIARKICGLSKMGAAPHLGACIPTPRHARKGCEDPT
eukprot:CAMPEP_0177533080 /NCGR_PEP_ID=MMETSP0369-20130122/55082_1 /TAXON_ID=447022 ORGANISM="Scrippsiella hangoei-like, Strain SHHI-4" /NCGR_SAMPLE_ID=MMETSP0369 /ASSEMBLY_ACC=CAM_ASM_000364 /LENGTH=62 /DNA_ID=CAMNT_0019014659 /DNA_START=58 /DNA_END=242 /DNA_ORIENTATION=-